jgi:dynein heavy chain
MTLDGPVDPIWIENLNSALDENKILCLSNGQRIKLPFAFSLLFEVEDLNFASPATVSRCGMVYVNENQLGFVPVVKTWVTKYLVSQFKITYEEINVLLFNLEI